MELTIQILVGLVTLMLLGLGLMSMFAPNKMLANFSVEPIGISGLNTIRSVIGGLFLASVAILVISQMTGQTMGYLAVAILMAAIAVGRVVGLVMDGFEKAVVPPLLLELVIASILVAAHSQLIS
ncbi:DUF4345 family protein [Vibrio sp. HN007]|uniref:DUF4345 family protein n=1 Tax=Vibrio iocasae TaxID=3098914 RepID=UPI0035D4D435